METAQKKILIAEDSFALANLLNFLFSNAGFEVSICRSGDAAAKAAQERKFDAILVDQQMPAMTGVLGATGRIWRASSIVMAFESP